jgi:16S rRNA (guanine966-N2)-methyltransferase
MRIIGGRHRGRRLHTPDWPGLRPTSDRLRETLFNVLAPEVEGARVLDVYAGTGAVGLEAVSRGALSVTFVEKDRRAVALLRRNAEAVGDGACAIVARDAVAALRAPMSERFDIVFLDPPYAESARDEALLLASRHVAAGGVLVLEHATREPAPGTTGALVRVRTLRQGDSSLAFYRAAAPGRLTGDGDE